MSPASGTHVSSLAVLVRGSIEAGAKLWVNGVETEVDGPGDFLVPVAVGAGDNTVTIEVTAADGKKTTRSLLIIGDK